MWPSDNKQKIFQPRNRDWWVLVERWLAERKNLIITATHFLTLHYILIKTNIACIKDFNSSLSFPAESLSCFQKGMFTSFLTTCNKHRLKLIKIFLLLFFLHHAVYPFARHNYQDIIARHNSIYLEIQRLKLHLNDTQTEDLSNPGAYDVTILGLGFPCLVSSISMQAHSFSTLPGFRRLYPLYLESPAQMVNLWLFRTGCNWWLSCTLL